jgi:glycosyltransferase involved in cell wall biosynthesis
MNSYYIEPKNWKPSFQRLIESGDIAAAVRFVAARISDYEKSFVNAFDHYFDEDIDQLLKLYSESKSNEIASSDGAIIHLASAIYDWGGHTLQILDFIRAIPEKRHKLLITDIPSLITGELGKASQASKRLQEFNSLGVEVEFFDGSLNERIAAISKKLDGSSMVFLHHHPWDAVAVLACLRYSGRKIINFHSDNSLTLGLTLGWDIVCYRETTRSFFEQKLPASRFFVVPLTSNLEDHVSQISRSNRERVITVGASSSPKKIYPFSRADYFHIVGAMTRDFNVTHFHIGPMTAQIRGLKCGYQRLYPTMQKRMKLKTLVPHLQNSELAYADLFIDSTPISGGKTVIDALALGVPVVTFPAGHNDLIANFDYAVRSGLSFKSYTDFAEWFEIFTADAAFRNGIRKKCREYYEAFHSNAVFKASVQKMIRGIQDSRPLDFPDPKTCSSLCMAHAYSVQVVDTLSVGLDGLETSSRIFLFARRIYQHYFKSLPGAKRLAHHIKNILSRF